MTRRQTETERKFALTPGQILPEVSTLGTPGPVRHHDLVATYYDTLDYRLTRAHQVIRHRTGGDDAGWHLKQAGPDAEHRIEFHLPGDRGPVPQEFRDRVADDLRQAALFPVAVLRTSRAEQPLYDPEGVLLALICTDQVTAEVGGREQHWWEAEFELAAGDPGLLDRFEALCAEVGIHRAGGPSKIGHALSEELALVPPAPDQAAASHRLREYLAEQVGVLQDREAAVKLDAPDAVHRSRVASRRLRSALRTYQALFATAPAALRSELRWYGEILGPPRDAEVLRERMAEAVTQLDSADRVLVQNRLNAHLDLVHQAALNELFAAMRTPRHRLLQHSLSQLLAEPGWSAMAQRPAAQVMPGLLAGATARVIRLLAHAEARPADLSRWHEVRKAAKAVRYGCEVLVPTLGDPLDRWRSIWEEVTEALGQVQDAVVAQHLIGDLSWEAVAAGEPRRPYDDLRYVQDALLREGLAAGRDALTRATADPAVFLR